MLLVVSAVEPELFLRGGMMQQFIPQR